MMQMCGSFTKMEGITLPANVEMFTSAYENIVDIVIDGGPGGNIASTVIDYTGSEPLLVRDGAGKYFAQGI